MSNAEKPFRQLVGEHIGRASVCWDELPHGVFDSNKAIELTNEIVAAYDTVVKERDELRLANPNAGSTDTLTEKYNLRRERDALQAAESCQRTLATNLRIELDALAMQLAELKGEPISKEIMEMKAVAYFYQRCLALEAQLADAANDMRSTKSTLDACALDLRSERERIERLERAIAYAKEHIDAEGSLETLEAHHVEIDRLESGE